MKSILSWIIAAIAVLGITPHEKNEPGDVTPSPDEMKGRNEMKYYAEQLFPLMELDHLRLNPVESSALFHWECKMESNEKDGWWDEEMDAVHHEVDFFIDCVLPKEPTEGWAMWTDGAEVLSKSEEIVARMSRVFDIFADGHYGYYDPDEDEQNNEVDDHTGYWYADWD